MKKWLVRIAWSTPCNASYLVFDALRFFIKPDVKSIYAQHIDKAGENVDRRVFIINRAEGQVEMKETHAKRDMQYVED